MQKNTKFIFKITILSVFDNKIRITVDDKRIPTYNQEGNLSEEPITKKPMVVESHADNFIRKEQLKRRRIVCMSV